MPLQFISVASNAPAGAAINVATPAFPVVLGDLIVVFAGSAGPGITRTITDSQGNLYTSQPNQEGTAWGGRSAFVLAAGATGLLTVTCTFNVAIGNRSIAALVYRGIAAFRADAAQVQGAVGPGANVATSGALAGIQATDLVVGYCNALPGGPATLTPGSPGFIDRGTVFGSPLDRLEDKIAGTVTAATFSTTVNPFAVDVVTFGLAFIDNTPLPLAGLAGARSSGRRPHRR